MTLIAELTVPGEPRAKARPRVTRYSTYTPKTTTDYEAAIRRAWDVQPRRERFACVRLEVDFYLGTRRRVDVDNCVKCVKDALNDRAYQDDWQVHELAAQKFYTTRDRARTVVRIYSIPPERDETDAM